MVLLFLLVINYDILFEADSCLFESLIYKYMYNSCMLHAVFVIVKLKQKFGVNGGNVFAKDK